MSSEEWQQTRLIGELDDEEQIDSADDEELDSDAAFDESDEERYAGFFSRKNTQIKQTTKPTVRFTDVDLDEDQDINSLTKEEEEEEAGDPDEFIDLLDVLDGKGEIDTGSGDEKPRQTRKPNDSDDELDEDEEQESDEESEEEDNDDAFSASDIEDTPKASDKFYKFISGLETTAKKRKADDAGSTKGPAGDAQSRKRRHIAERTEAGAEDEFHAHASGSKLQLNDLLAPLATQSSNLLSLKSNTKALSANSTKIKTLSAPLPQRTQERLDREAAYEQTRDEVEKWSTTMKRIQEAEHLSFPLQARSSGRVSNLELAAKFKPSTHLESSIDSLLRSAKMRDEDIEQTEDTHMLKTNKLTIEEVAARRAELRHMRELMFRAEIKAKRISKIKSKVYRKIKRKEKEKLKEKILEADGLGRESETEEGRLKMEVERARERATLRHKHTGKWARQMKQRHYDEGGREEMEEMLHRGEQLRRKIQGVDSDGSVEGGSSDEDEEIGINTEEDLQKIKKAAFDELNQLDSQTNNVGSNGVKGKGVFEMKFMKDAMARDQAHINRMTDDFVKEMGGELDEGSDDEHQDQGGELDDGTSGVLANRTGGRLAFRPGAPQSTVPQVALPSMGSLASDTSSVTLKSTDLLSDPPTSPKSFSKVPSRLSNATASGSPADAEDVNPWLMRITDSSMKVTRKKNHVFGKDSKLVEKSKNKLKKMSRKSQEEKEKAQQDATIEISTDQVLSLNGAEVASSLKSKSVPDISSTKTTIADDDSDTNSEIDVQEAAILKTSMDANPKGLKAFQQRDLVALAFAGDNVVHEFEEIKKREIAADAPKDIDTTIPGWGSWGGQGTKRAPPKPERIKKLAGVDPKSRADYNKKHVIISEKRDKKASKYLVKDLPYPYTSRGQFERSMEQPLGKEWNTRVGFQRGTMPRVVKKPGVIIDPLEKMV